MARKKFITDEVGQTLLMTLFMRARESASENPIVHDPTAQRLVEEIDYDFSCFKDALITQLGCSIRSVHFDNVSRDFITKHERPLLVLIGTGLDSRVERLGQIAEKADFIHIDIPEVIKIRRQILDHGPNETLFAGSILDTDWMDYIQSHYLDHQILFVIEGVVMYFERCEVRRVFRRLAQRFSGAEILHDEISTFVAHDNRLHSIIKFSSSLFRSGCDDPYEMQSWADNLELIGQTRYADWPDAARSSLQAKVMYRIPFLANSARMLHYKIN